ncbi:MAG: zinc ribbon domain-containing protein [Vampirovibrionales bacterium]|nr:zinc ribbon domain-containing protein [Vampirovibrionales bacterium]
MTFQPLAYQCAKCNHYGYTEDEIRATGKWSRFFDWQNKRFKAVSCAQCGYSEFYKLENKGFLGNFFDLWFSG